MDPAESLAQALCDSARLLHERGMFAATEGNVSCRVAAQRILCSPSLSETGRLTPPDLCEVDAEGRPARSSPAPTSELPLHLSIYRGSPDAAAVIHCHPPHATAVAITQRAVPRGVLAEAEFYLGHIPIIDYRPPGSTALAKLLEPYAAECRCALLRNHGAVSWDRTPQRARWWMEVLDAYCRVLILAGAYGPCAPLSEADVNDLRRRGREL